MMNFARWKLVIMMTLFTICIRTDGALKWLVIQNDCGSTVNYTSDRKAKATVEILPNAGSEDMITFTGGKLTIPSTILITKACGVNKNSLDNILFMGNDSSFIYALRQVMLLDGEVNGPPQIVRAPYRILQPNGPMATVYTSSFYGFKQ
jgi:hypothetical protein